MDWAVFSGRKNNPYFKEFRKMKEMLLFDIEYIVKIKREELILDEVSLPKFIYNEREIEDLRVAILSEGGFFRYLFREKGQVLLDKKTKDTDELIFWIFEPITAELGFGYATKICQDENQRKYAFIKQVELLNKVGVKKEYIDALKREYNTLLQYILFEDV